MLPAVSKSIRLFKSYITQAFNPRNIKVGVAFCTNIMALLEQNCVPIYQLRHSIITIRLTVLLKIYMSSVASMFYFKCMGRFNWQDYYWPLRPFDHRMWFALFKKVLHRLRRQQLSRVNNWFQQDGTLLHHIF